MNKRDYLELGATRWYQKDFKGAYEAYNQAICIDPSYAEAYCGRGYAQQDLRFFQGALDDYSKAIEMAPEFADAYLNRATLRSQMGDRQGALQDAGKAEELYQQQNNPTGSWRASGFISSTQLLKYF